MTATTRFAEHPAFVEPSIEPVDIFGRTRQAVFVPGYDRDPDTGERQAVADVGADYHLVPNRVLYDGALELAAAASKDFTEQEPDFNGVRFHGCVVLEDHQAVVLENGRYAEGDIVKLALAVNNTYNGAASAEIAFLVWRCVCFNQLVIMGEGFRIRARHQGDLEGRVEQHLKVLDGAVEFFQGPVMEHITEMTQLQPDHTQVGQLLGSLSPKYAWPVYRAWASQKSNTAWELFNNAQQMLDRKKKSHADRWRSQELLAKDFFFSQG